MKLILTAVSLRTIAWLCPYMKKHTWGTLSRNLCHAIIKLRAQILLKRRESISDQYNNLENKGTDGANKVDCEEEHWC